MMVSDFQDVMLDRMRPRQLATSRMAADVAFLPLGNLEWHGPHNPLGLDAIKAHNVCCRAAEVLGGGAVAPALLWGAPRDSFNVGVTGGAAGEIAAVLGTEARRWKGIGPHGGMDVQAQWLFYSSGSVNVPELLLFSLPGQITLLPALPRDRAKPKSVSLRLFLRMSPGVSAALIDPLTIRFRAGCGSAGSR